MSNIKQELKELADKLQGKCPSDCDLPENCTRYGSCAECWGNALKEAYDGDL